MQRKFYFLKKHRQENILGGAGSGGYSKKEFTDAEIENMRRWRMLGHSWEHIAYRLGMKSETPIERFRKENPEFDKEVGAAVLNLESALIQDLVKLVRNLIGQNKSPPPEIVKMLMQYFKVFEKEQKTDITAIQVNAQPEAGIQVNFVSPEDVKQLSNPLQKQTDVIDV
jgi:hypothetical protein